MKKVTAYMDDKGNIHPTKLLCEQANAFDKAIDLVEEHMHPDMRADDIVNMIQNDKVSRAVFKELIDTSEKMEKAMYSDKPQSFEETTESNETNESEKVA